MEIVKLPGMNRELQPPPNWDAEKDGECGVLPVFAEVVDGHMCMTSAWKPTAEELAHLNAGGAVALVIYGTMHPPIAVGVFPAENVPAEPKAEQLVVRVDGSALDGFVKRMVAAVQKAVDGLQPPAHITDQRKEYWKGGARAAIRAIDAAIQSVPVEEPDNGSLPTG